MKKRILGLLIALSMLVGLGVQASGSAISPSCQEAVSAFLATPAKRTLLALSGSDDADCWAAIGSSNANLNQLIHSVKQGNRWAAQYLAKHLRKLDGGNLEDSLIALGQFSDHNMERLLIFANKSQLSKHELTDALTMLPLSLSDNPQAQLASLKARRSSVMRVTRKELTEQRALALRAIDDFVSEIRSKNPTKNKQSVPAGSNSLTVKVIAVASHTPCCLCVRLLKRAGRRPGRQTSPSLMRTRTGAKRCAYRASLPGEWAHFA